MRINEILLMDEEVYSSWIQDLTFVQGGVQMTLLSGRQYMIHGVDEDDHAAWVVSISPGGFWHTNIRGSYSVDRIA